MEPPPQQSSIHLPVDKTNGARKPHTQSGMFEPAAGQDHTITQTARLGDGNKGDPVPDPRLPFAARPVKNVAMEARGAGNNRPSAAAPPKTPDPVRTPLYAAHIPPPNHRLPPPQRVVVAKRSTPQLRRSIATGLFPCELRPRRSRICRRTTRRRQPGQPSPHPARLLRSAREGEALSRPREEVTAGGCG